MAAQPRLWTTGSRFLNSWAKNGWSFREGEPCPRLGIGQFGKVPEPRLWGFLTLKSKALGILADQGEFPLWPKGLVRCLSGAFSSRGRLAFGDHFQWGWDCNLGVHNLPATLLCSREPRVLIEALLGTFPGHFRRFSGKEWEGLTFRGTQRKQKKPPELCSSGPKCTRQESNL